MKARKVLHSKLEVFKESRFSPSMLIRHLSPLVAIALKIPNKMNSANLTNHFFLLSHS